MADAYDSKSYDHFGHEGSNPSLGTKKIPKRELALGIYENKKIFD